MTNDVLYNIIMITMYNYNFEIHHFGQSVVCSKDYVWALHLKMRSTGLFTFIIMTFL